LFYDIFGVPQFLKSLHSYKSQYLLCQGWEELSKVKHWNEWELRDPGLFHAAHGGQQAEMGAALSAHPAV